MSNHRKILCLDFDGVLHSYVSGWKGARLIPDPPVPGAMKFLVEAVDYFSVSIYSSRSRYLGGRRAMKRWLLFHLSEYWWSLPPRVPLCRYLTTVDMEEGAARWARSVVRQIDFPLWKPPAHLTIDDRAVTFRGIWPHPDSIRDFKPWRVDE